jgi:DNA-binding HxlR family transcriptional regulator
MKPARSTCSINRGVELLGDRWSLVVLRDVILHGRRSFNDLLQHSEEGITASVLSARLKALVAASLLVRDQTPRGVQGRYSLTELGIELVPLLFEFARIGSLVSPGSSTPEQVAAYGDRRFMESLMDRLRSEHLQPTG